MKIILGLVGFIGVFLGVFNNDSTHLICGCIWLSTFVILDRFDIKRY